MRKDEFHDKRASVNIVFIGIGLWDLYILILYNHYCQNLDEAAAFFGNATQVYSPRSVSC